MSIDTYITPSHYKRVAKSDKPLRYSPVELVKQHGDSWVSYISITSIAVSVYEYQSGINDFMAMRDMELGVRPRIGK